MIFSKFNLKWVVIFFGIGIIVLFLAVYFYVHLHYPRILNGSSYSDVDNELAFSFDNEINIPYEVAQIEVFDGKHEAIRKTPREIVLKNLGFNTGKDFMKDPGYQKHLVQDGKFNGLWVNPYKETRKYGVFYPHFDVGKYQKIQIKIHTLFLGFIQKDYTYKIEIEPIGE